MREKIIGKSRQIGVIGKLGKRVIDKITVETENSVISRPMREMEIEMYRVSTEVRADLFATGL